MGRKISIVSGKGGVGKTTVACALALSLMRNGHSVCLVDLDVGLNNLDILMGVQNKIIYDLNDCLKGKCRIKQALITDPRFEGVYLLSSSKNIDEDHAVISLNEIINKLAGVFDFVIIDAPAGIGKNFEFAINCSNESLVVVTPHINSLRDADRVISTIKGQGVNNVGIVVNRIRGDMVLRKEMLSHIQIQKLLKTKVVGVIPESDLVSILSSYRFERIVKNNIISAFDLLAKNIKYDKVTIFDYQSKYKGLIGIIRRNIKRSI